jgi:hypothetical protein
MNSIRFWIRGMLCVAVVLTLATLDLIPGYDFPRHGYITGHVTLDGQAVTSGVVYFVSTDGDHVVLAKGAIDRNGDYSAYSTWQHRWERGAHFTMWVAPRSLLGGDARLARKIERNAPASQPSGGSTDGRVLTADSSAVYVVEPKTTQMFVDLNPSMHRIDVNLTGEERLASVGVHL